MNDLEKIIKLLEEIASLTVNGNLCYMDKGYPIWAMGAVHSLANTHLEFLKESRDEQQARRETEVEVILSNDDDILF